MKIVNAILIITLASGAALAEPTSQSLVSAALERTTHQVKYDGSYYAIPYPGGDVPDDVGVCTDVVIGCFPKHQGSPCPGPVV